MIQLFHPVQFGRDISTVWSCFEWRRNPSQWKRNETFDPLLDDDPRFVEYDLDSRMRGITREQEPTQLY